MESIPLIKFLRLRPNLDADIPLPRYMTPQSAGMDICAALENDVILETGEIALLPTGFAMAIPEGFEAQIRPRSGLAVKNGIGLINSPGTIDADYRGEIGIILINLSDVSFVINDGERICQMVINKVEKVSWTEVASLEDSERGVGGFGHTGSQ